MKTSTIVRLIALGVLVAGLFVWAGALSAADPTGGSPANGIPMGVGPTETCTSQTIAPGAQVWLQVPYHSGKDLEMHVKNAAGVNFDVYDPSQIANWPMLPAQPTGRLTPNSNEPGYTETWQGHLGIGNQSGFFYVLVTNTNASPVTFSFCTIETEKYTPAAQSPATTESAPPVGDVTTTTTLTPECAPDRVNTTVTETVTGSCGQ